MIESAAKGHAVPHQGYRERQGHSEWDDQSDRDGAATIAAVGGGCSRKATRFLSRHIRALD